MTPPDDVDDPPATPSGLEQVTFAIGNLWDDFGSTESPLLGLAVNLGLAAIGVLVYWQATGLVAYVGGVWAILNLLGIVSWVMRL